MSVTSRDLATSRDQLRQRWVLADVRTMGTGCHRWGKGLNHFHPPDGIVEGHVVRDNVNYMLCPLGWVQCPGPYKPGLRDLFATTGSGPFRWNKNSRPTLLFDEEGLFIIYAAANGDEAVVGPGQAPLELLRELSVHLAPFLQWVETGLAQLAAAEVSANAAALHRIDAGGR
jgi:hypothetical protein